MKKSEIALVILVVSVVAFGTYLLVNTFIAQQTLKPAKVEKVDPISQTVQEPSTTIFNKDAINPTVKVKIGDLSGRQPFTIGQ